MYFLENKPIRYGLKGRNLPPTNAGFYSRIGQIVETAIQQIPIIYHDVSVERYCIMPDHVHMILRIQSSNADGRQVAAPAIPTVVR